MCEMEFQESVSKATPGKKKCQWEFQEIGALKQMFDFPRSVALKNIYKD